MIEAMVIILYMYIARDDSIKKLQTWIGKFNQPALINKVEPDYLKIFRVQNIKDERSIKTITTVAFIFGKKKKE